jgi:hypothetical protein
MLRRDRETRLCVERLQSRQQPPQLRHRLGVVGQRPPVALPDDALRVARHRGREVSGVSKLKPVAGSSATTLPTSAP